MTKRYQELLDEFVDQSDRLIDGGLQHFVVVASHELYRFLYPVEPYCQFTHEDPVPWIEGHIEKLVGFLRSCDSTFMGYVNCAKPGEGGAEERELPKSTSDLYSDLWQGFSKENYVTEAKHLIERRLSEEFIAQAIVGKRCLDIGCGSGRYALALAMLGAKQVVAVDFQAKAYGRARKLAEELELPVEFREADVLNLPFDDASFETVFSNGVLHHTSDWKRGVDEYARVMQPGGNGFLYLYATGGIFWTTRIALRKIFSRIPKEQTQSILVDMGMPSNRFIFMDTWYVPTEGHIAMDELESKLRDCGLEAEKVRSQNPFDLDTVMVQELQGSEEMWGEGEHRYLLKKQ